MRCRACDKRLDDQETTNKRLIEGEWHYYDMCRWCLHQSNIQSELEDIYEEREHIQYDENRGAEDDDPYGDEIEW